MNINDYINNKIEILIKNSKNKISELKKSDSNRSSDIENINKLNGKIETYNSMLNILSHDYTVTRVIELLDITKNQLRNEIYSELSNHYIGNTRKSPETWEKIQVLCGKSDALIEVRKIIDNAFNKE